MSYKRHMPDFKMIASMGLVHGCTPLFKFGKNQDIDTGSAPEDVISIGGEKLFPNAASTISFVSTSASDTDGGTGINTLIVEGLDSNFDIISETITLNGTTPVVSSLSYLRANRVTGTLSGSAQKAVGVITGTHDEGTIVQIPTGDGQSSDATYTVPSGHVLMIDRFTASLERSSAGAGAEIHFEIKPFGTNTWQEKADASLAASGTSYIQRDTDLWFAIPEKADVRLHVSQVANNNTFIAASFDGLLIDLALFAW